MMSIGTFGNSFYLHSPLEFTYHASVQFIYSSRLGLSVDPNQMVPFLNSSRSDFLRRIPFDATFGFVP
jgi:hypothetical protein